MIQPAGRRQFLRLLPEKDFDGHAPPPPTLPRPGDHHQEWVRACRTGGTPGSNFAYAGPFTETVLLGVVGWRAGRRVEWDAKNLKVSGCPEPDPLIGRDYRKGWEL